MSILFFRLLELLPEPIARLLSDGGTFVVIILLAAGFGTLLWKVVAEVLTEKLRGYLGQGLVQVVLFVYILPILFSLLTYYFITALTTGLSAATAWVVRSRVHRGLLNLWIIAAQVSVFLTVHLGEEWFLKEPQNAQAKVYLTLSFEKIGSEPDDKLIDISAIYRATLEEAFSDVPSIVIEPRSFDKDVFNVYSIQHYSITGVRDQLKRKNFSPIVVLRNTASLPNPESKTSPVFLVTTLISFQKNGLDEIGDEPISQIGTIADTRYLALKATFALLATLKVHSDLKLSPEQETNVKKRIFKMYRDFLGLRKDAVDSSVFEKLERARTLDLIPDEKIGSLLNAYISPADMASYDSEVASIRNANLAKLGVKQ